MTLRLGPEDSLQASCMRWHKMQYPNDMIFSVPNAAKRGFVVQKIMKMTGMRAGVWDLFLPEPRGCYHGLFMELKTKTRKLSPEQVIFGNHVLKMGYKTAGPIYTFEQYVDVVKGYKALCDF